MAQPESSMGRGGKLDVQQETKSIPIVGDRTRHGRGRIGRIVAGHGNTTGKRGFTMSLTASDRTF